MPRNRRKDITQEKLTYIKNYPITVLGLERPTRVRKSFLQRMKNPSAVFCKKSGNLVRIVAIRKQVCHDKKQKQRGEAQ